MAFRHALTQGIHVLMIMFCLITSSASHGKCSGTSVTWGVASREVSEASPAARWHPLTVDYKIFRRWGFYGVRKGVMNLAMGWVQWPHAWVHAWVNESCIFTRMCRYMVNGSFELTCMGTMVFFYHMHGSMHRSMGLVKSGVNVWVNGILKSHAWINTWVNGSLKIMCMGQRMGQ